MNKERRKRIAAVVEKLCDCWQELETLRDEEQDYFDNMPESFQAGDKGTAADNAVTSLDDALNSTVEAKDTLESMGE